MGVWITEYPGLSFVGGRIGSIPLETRSTASTTVCSSATTSTMILAATTQVIRIASTQNCWILCSLSSASTSVATSTNTPLTQPNTYDYRAVKPGSRLTCLST